MWPDMRLQLTAVAMALCSSASLIAGCNGDGDDGPPDSGPSDVWDIDRDGIPKFVATNYIELDPIYRISKFRSSIGHDYADAFESCRSLKHYFEPKVDADWSAIKVFSPVAGTITRVDMEWAGTKLEIASDDYPAFRFSIFHINEASPHQLNDHVDEGQQLGTHIGSQTMSDIAVIVNETTRQGKMISYFDVITDDVFADYMARGVQTRDELIIPKLTRDESPLTCQGDTFTSVDPLEPWVTLQ